MQLTIDSDEPLADVLRVVGGLYGVTLATADTPSPGGAAESSPSGRRRSTRPKPDRGSARRSAKTVLDAKDVRTWASENGFEVNARGALSAAVRDAYRAAHPA